MDSSVAPKDDIWFLRVCHHISNAVYYCHRVLTQLHLTNILYYKISLLLQELTTSVSLDRMNSLHTFQSFIIYFNIILSPVCACHQSGIPVSGFPLTTLHACLLLHVTWPAHLTHLSLMILIMFGEQLKLWNSALCTFLHPCHFLLLRPKCFPQYRVLKHLSLREIVSP
jgi:hypothetical protein